MTRLAVALLFLVLLAPPLAAEAQAGKVWRVGVLAAGSQSSVSPYLERFREGLRQRGHVEGQHLVIEYRWADGKFERLSALAAELVALKVDVILASTTPAAKAAEIRHGQTAGTSARRC